MKIAQNKPVWRVHTPQLLGEILNNSGTGVLTVPLRILLSVLHEVAARAIQLDDHELNALMIRLTLYSVADPSSPDYDKSVVEKFIP
jgi:hypothetical protein